MKPKRHFERLRLELAARFPQATWRPRGPYVIRALTDNPNPWLSDGGDDAALAKTVFTGEDNEPVSVFVVQDHESEARAMVAHYLGRSASWRKPIFALRIDLNVLNRCGVRLDDAWGDTGVEEVNAIHWDLRGPAASYIRIAQHCRMCCLKGEDRLRRLEKDVPLRVLDYFLALPETQMSATARLKARRALNAEKAP